MRDSNAHSVAVIGGGNLGSALARGWVTAGLFSPASVHVTRRHEAKLLDLREEGFSTGTDNRAAVASADCVVLAVQPAQLGSVLDEVAPELDADRHTLVSLATGVSIESIRARIGPGVPIVRAMPNTAVETLSSMTCLSAEQGDERGGAIATELFDAVGRTLHIDEEMMIPATALCACGIAFFLRTIRAAAQGGTEIGFHADEALLLAAQTARGAADLVLRGDAHPESEIDRVTTPRGCTIAGLNELEHRGFSSAMIRGILTSSNRAGGLG